MLLNIAWNEFRYMLRSPQTFVAFAIFFLLTFFAMVSDNIQIGAGGNVNANSPFAIMETLITMNIFVIFVVPAYIANAILKDHEHKMDGIIFSTPITKPAYIFGRFLGAFTAMFVAMAATPLGMLIGTFWPSVDPETLAPTNLYHYLYSYTILVGSSMLVFSTIVFAIATLTRSVMSTYLATMGLLVAYFIASRYFNDPEFRDTMAMMDPFLSRGLTEATRYWTAIERNTRLMPVEGTILLNRLIWGGISVVLLIASYTLFSFRSPAGIKTEKANNNTNSKPIVLKAPRIAPDSSSYAQFIMRTKFEISAVIKSAPFLVIVGFTFFLVISALLNRNIGFGLDALPITRLMVQGIQGLALAFLVLIIFYSADIIWRERKNGIHEIIDATPVPSLVFVASKMIALALVLAIVLVIGIVMGIMVQLMGGADSIDMSLYFNRGFAHFIYPFLLASVLAIFVQVILKNRFVGMMVMVVYLIATLILSQFGFEHPLYFYASNIPTPLSDLNGSGRYIEADFWLKAYWSFLAVLLVMMSYMLWNRGTLQPLSLRIRRLTAFKQPVAATIAVISLFGFVGTGSFIFYNTNILNEYLTADDIEQLQVEYEARFRQYQNLPQPRTVAVKMDVDLYPHKGRVETRGYHLLENKTDSAIEQVHLVFPVGLNINSIAIQNADIEMVDKRYNYYIFALSSQMQPGDTRELTFDVSIEQRGFTHTRNSVNLVRNGTFINNNDIAPHIGFSHNAMLQDRNSRRRHELEPLPRTPKLEDKSQYGNSFIRQDSDFVTFETTVSTVGSQIAIAPGYLQREWQEEGRNYYHYKMDAPIQNYYSYLSADYEVVREDWNGIAIEVYHHAPHTYNISRMVESVKDSIAYFSKAFSPYQHKQLRIVEFPAYRRFAEAFPNTVPYSEGIGFIADLTDEEAIDLAYYVTSHEVAHQWWAHQVMPANTQGGSMMLETLAQYSALLVMEKKYGKNQMRKFLKYELDRYLSGRANDPEGELPLYRTENQNYIHYRKGSVVMYALRDYLGEQIVNRALSRLVKELGFSSEPYATSLDLLRLLREEAPEHDQLITDLFERITLFDLKTLEVDVVALDDGKYQVELIIEAAKYEADEEGTETSLSLNDMIDIGIFTASPADSRFADENVTYLTKHLVTATTQTIEIIVDKIPTHAGIDPYNKLIDRNSNDNIIAVPVKVLAAANSESMLMKE
ncbi:ABC transporter permease subunit [Endozoicomonas sp. G2_1]|uniref:ABC transporter permease/M1 family aminopeptidase n=1 Tax=Endozoicomonas sp. G2_1 TaxID=2821091 RepID=UPI001AD9E8B8|nr:ABC transporter permease subunit [Endozoicomonas sp. G2_1]MBO9491153.1 ABC transporter permease subunit [Endozoicomonas sp. G2_1]